MEEEPLSSQSQPLEDKQKKKRKKKELLNSSSTFLDAATVQPCKEQRSKLGWELESQYRSEEEFEASAIINEIRYLLFVI